MRTKPFVRRILVVSLITAIIAAFGVEPFPCRAQEVLLGDVSGDGDITSVDASMTLQIANGILFPTAAQRSAADANQDGDVTPADAATILQCAAEKCSAFTWKTLGSRGGTLEAEDLTITIPPGTFSEEATIIVKTIDPYPVQYENLDALGSFYQLEQFPRIQQPITIEISFDPGAISTEESFYIYQEQMSYITGGGGVTQSGHPRVDTEVDRINGTATIQIVPRETNPAAASSNILLNSPESQGSYLSNDLNTIILGALTGARKPPQVIDDYFHVIDLTNNGTLDLEKIKQPFHEAKDELEDLGFIFEERIKPVEVRIIDSLHTKEDEAFAETFYPDCPKFFDPHINILPGLSGDTFKIAAGHELFHILQFFYGAYRSDCLGFATTYRYKWLREASSVWFEKKVSETGGEYFSERAEAHKDFIYSALETEKITHGYGASSFLTYLTDEYSDELILTIYQKIKNQEDNGTSTGALQAALGGSDRLSELFREFAFKFISKTTEHANWTEPYRPDAEIDMGKDQKTSQQQSLSALSAWNLKVNPKFPGFPLKDYTLEVSLEGGNQFITGAVYTRDGEGESSGPWKLEFEFSPGETREVEHFYNGRTWEKCSANVILVNQQAEHPYNQVVPVTLHLKVKEKLKSIVGTWDVKKYDYLCQGFYAQTGDLFIYPDYTYKIDLSEGNVEGFEGTWFLQKESALGGSLLAYFYSGDELKFRGFVNDTYDEITNDWFMTGSSIVCVHAEKISDTVSFLRDGVYTEH